SLVAVADPDGVRRAHLAALVGDDVASFPDASALIEGADVDALVLANPASAHVVDAERATAAGLPVLVEKPPAPDRIGAARLAELGSTVRVGFNRRFDPGFGEVRAATPPTGVLDLELEIRYRRASWNAHRVRDDVILDLGPHLLDLARWVSASEIHEIAAIELTPDRATLSLVLGRGRATLRARADSSHAERVSVRLAGGATIARHRAGGRLAAVTGRLRPSSRPHPLVASLAAQLDSFSAVARGGLDPVLGTAEDGVAVMAAVDAARTSAASAGRPTAVADPTEPASC
ncbi:MAG: Gfo/Idh/MocA family protein, partial [Acidimicrobiales bacterium]